MDIFGGTKYPGSQPPTDPGRGRAAGCRGRGYPSWLQDLSSRPAPALATATHVGQAFVWQIV